MLPAVAIAAWGVDATTALVLSQVVLSLVLPVPMAALVFFTSRKSVMGDEANGWPTTIVAAAATLLVLALNLVLVLGTFGIELPL
jgi:manganese transport protein